MFIKVAAGRKLPYGRVPKSIIPDKYIPARSRPNYESANTCGYSSAYRLNLSHGRPPLWQLFSLFLKKRRLKCIVIEKLIVNGGGIRWRRKLFILPPLV